MTSTGSWAWSSAPTIILSKPFNPRELVARIRAILRRASSRSAAAACPTNSSSARSRCNTGTHQVHVAATPVPLTGAEFRVLELLMRSAGQVISRDAMTEQALGRKLVAYDRSIDTHISNLRRKLDLRGGQESRDQERPRFGLYAHLGRMHSLFLRIFMLFWVAMALIVGGSIAITFTIAAREYEAPELQRRPSVAIQASEVLARGGIGALKSWLNANKNSIADRDLFIVGPDGADILGRRLPEDAARAGIRQSRR